MTMHPRVAVIFARLGPYHVARLTAASACFEKDRFLALEVAAESREYAWDRVETQGFRRRTAIADRDYQDVSDSDRAEALRRTLEEEQPEVVAIVGWGFAECRAALAWCRRNGRTAILMSESQERDFRRDWIREKLKRALVREFDAALVGGHRHVEYLVKLGMPADRVVRGYDVVDNDHFALGADAARCTWEAERRRRALPRDYFLCSARFVRKKNLAYLLREYADYRAQVGHRAWKLVLLGDGPLRPRLEREIRKLALEPDALLPGFKQYAELPAYYGLARAFVLPSLAEQWGLVVNEAMAAGLPVLVSQACGSSELVEPDVNGWIFDATQPGALAERMRELHRQSEAATVMGLASRRRIAAWGPEAFATGLTQAIKIGEAHLRARKPNARLTLALRL